MLWMSCVISNIVLASLLALTAWCVQRRLRWSAVARILWVLALIKLVTPPMVSVPVVELPGAMACALGICHCPHHAGTLAIIGRKLPWLLLTVWATGMGTMAWTAWRRWIQFRRLISHARAAPREWQSLAKRLSSKLSIRRPPEILAMSGRLPPLVVPGLRRPRMLLPEDLMGRLNRSQRVALLLHELTHIKRGDHLVRMLELAVRVTFWWLPIVGWIGRQLRACEETCCDAAVVANRPQARREYARLLLEVIDFSVPLPRPALPQATAMSAVNHLEQRLHAILDSAPIARRRWPTAAFTLGLACIILPCELRYNFAGPGAPRATLSEGGLATLAKDLPADGSDTNQSAAFCCPH